MQIKVNRQQSATPLLLSISILLIFCSCSTRQAADAHKTDPDERFQTKPMEATPRVNDPVTSGFFNGAPEEQKEAWLSFVRDGKYRIAQPDDFNFPFKAMELQGNDIEKSRQQPYMGGDINRDGISNDFAAIVVENDIGDAMRHCLVIFTQSTDSTGSYTQQFLYTRRDLSKTRMEWASGRLSVREYFEDGSYRYCHVKWNKSLGRYHCEDESR